MLRQLFTVCACVGLTLAAGGTWDYNVAGSYGPGKWPELFGTCSGDRQSPVDIKDGDVLYDKDLEDFRFVNYLRMIKMEMSNNGHSVKVVFKDTKVPEINQGSLGSEYKAAQFHFHWGSTSAQGSEHLFNHHAYPMELHVVHYNTKYADLAAAVGNADGLAVIGFMYEIQESNNTNYSNLVDKLSEIQAINEKVTLDYASMASFLPETYETSKWYRYLGSLTTPTCNEVVTWTVMTDSIKISDAQLAQFRRVLDSHSQPIVDNYRPVQALKSRVVSANYKPDLHWGYATYVAPAQWQDYYGACGGSSQSPIDIPKFDAVPVDSFPPFQMSGYNNTDGLDLKLSNNGHTAKIAISGEVSISGGDLKDTYKALQLHFHWGRSSDMGSEHLVAGKAYPMELHIVHYNSSMSVNDAVVTRGGLAVLGFFFEETERDNPNYAAIVAALGDVKNPKNETPIAAMRMDSLIPDASLLNHYYRYQGSLTTPGCYESVTWTVFTQTIPLSRSQLSAFRSLWSAEKNDNNLHLTLVNNFRPPQPLNNREVKVAVPKWSYAGHLGRSGPGAAAWGDFYPYCKDDAGSRQSPINIDPTTVSLNLSLKTFSMSNWNTPNDMVLANSGHSVKVSFKNDVKTVTTSGGGLGHTYRLLQFHFHWGANSQRGSEHLIDSEAYPMEVHFVHYNTKYGTVGNALKHSDGLAVLGFMFKIGDGDNAAFEQIVSKLSSAVNPGSKVTLASFAADSFLPSGLSEYYRYMGSLTTPGCYEAVVWTLFREPIVISERQMAEFRKLQSSEKDANYAYLPMVDNFRPVQQRHGREIQATFLIGAAGATSQSLLTVAVWVVVAVARWW